MANGKTAVELWGKGEIVDGKNKILEEDTTTVSTIAPVDLQPSNNNVNNVAISPTPSKGATTEGIPTSKEPSVLLDKLRTSTRSGDKTVTFTTKNNNPDTQRSRKPKFERAGSASLKVIENLRQETERRNRNFLMSVFSRVNGNEHTTRELRHARTLIKRNINIEDR